MNDSSAVLLQASSCSLSSEFANATSSTTSSGTSDAWGFVALGIAVLGFGSNFVPVKKFKTGDGVFFQWVMCCAVWISGVITLAITGFPKFEPVAMLGGVLWCSGNILAVPIIHLIGLALGLSLWGVTNLLMGWCSGTFGLFGLHKQTVATPEFNYVGATVCVLAVVIFAMVKSKPKSKEESTRLTDREVVVGGDWGEVKVVHDSGSGDTEAQDSARSIEKVAVSSTGDTDLLAYLDRIPVLYKRIVGIGLALISGLFYGSNFDPPQWLIDHGEDGEKHSANGIDYVFPHFCGIFLTSTAYFLIYCAAMKNRPRIYPEAITPGFISGLVPRFFFFFLHCGPS
eukprot:TRINITY_DN3698_c0_g1_i1.p1 TRINITY_DN3698_c0_g1~~TRINITY_DN3698_c0_g1_i1.p1  ORF type:complete len:363 (-),score=77.55 TRINITY_DN3698_c0_g1_i1:276-1301(-)